MSEPSGKPGELPSQPPPEKNCGFCRWFELNDTPHYTNRGTCEILLPPVVTYLTRGDSRETWRGSRCDLWQPKEKG